MLLFVRIPAGPRHDFRLFKESGVHIDPGIRSLTDTAYQGIHKLHQNSALPKKKTKKNPLTKEDKKKNRELSREQVLNENVIGMIKRFKNVMGPIYSTTLLSQRLA